MTRQKPPFLCESGGYLSSGVVGVSHRFCLVEVVTFSCDWIPFIWLHATKFTSCVQFNWYQWEGTWFWKYQFSPCPSFLSHLTPRYQIHLLCAIQLVPVRGHLILKVSIFTLSKLSDSFQPGSAEYHKSLWMQKSGSGLHNFKLALFIGLRFPMSIFCARPLTGAMALLIGDRSARVTTRCSLPSTFYAVTKNTLPEDRSTVPLIVMLDARSQTILWFLRILVLPSWGDLVLWSPSCYYGELLLFHLVSSYCNLGCILLQFKISRVTSFKMIKLLGKWTKGGSIN